MSTVTSPMPAMEPHARTFHDLKSAFEVLESLVTEHARLSSETANAMQTLTEICEERFRIEEQAPLLEDVREKAPWLKEKAAVFSNDHDTLRTRLHSLSRCSLKQLPLPRPWQEMAEELAFFKRQLALHEEAECEFWQQIYGMDVGTKD